MLPRRRHLAWFIPDSLSGFFSRLLGGEKGALRASLRVTNRRHQDITQMKKNVPIFLRLLLLLSAAGLSFAAQAGGIALGATRVIYPQGSKQTSLPIINSSASNVFLIQSWVANADGSRSTDFIITPPLFVIQPKKENILRIMYVGPSLPTDRESVFYLNSKAIPSVDKNKLTGNSLQIATQSVIKLFIRPKNLAEAPAHAPSTLRCRNERGQLTITNPSPYYVSMVELYSAGKKLPNTMVPPKGAITLPATPGQVSLRTVNDFGATTPARVCPAS
ncbi:chaperone protein FimC [Salmonella enterica subsp. enterica serovar Agona str. 22.H.04]|nr:fimbrial chaparone [Salmonella enterica subsp. enterica serovar Choleraesuis str. SC-B67]ACH50842.1 chaperone protein FimC [Salmonella enterica subsp. enterica serovar Agona str. SL483]ACY86566.1 fimbrial chaparone [Salmonella enterica subsp. enterica serovar Typhimurium str. 14028S]AHB42818.1 fimbrial chaperone protein BcfB [Salmonella enterica subsp. enterica serovar Agona str. 24249]ALP99622.1 fimbrial chaperone BcfB [Salmonella enterica subsp. enterica serovar Typhimurium]ARO96257.1 fim